MVFNLLFLSLSIMFALIEVTQAELVIFPDGTRTQIPDPTLYRADRTHSSQEHQKDTDSKVATHAEKGRSKGNEAMAAPSDKSSLCSSGDEAKDSTSSTADDVTDTEGDTKAETTSTTISRSTDEATHSEPFLYRADRTRHSSQEHQKDNDSQVETHAHKGRSEGIEAMAAPSDKSSHCSSGDEAIPSRSSTDVSTFPSRSSTDVSTSPGSSPTDAATTSGSLSTDAATTPGSSSSDKRSCSKLQHQLATATSTSTITKVLLDACRPQITDIAVVLHGVQSDDGPSRATEHLAHVKLVPLAATRCRAHGPSCSSLQSRLNEVTQPTQ